MQRKARDLKLHVTYGMLILPLQVCSVFYLATNTNGTLAVFFYHLFSVFYVSLFFSLRFLITFKRLTKTFQFLKIIDSGYSRSYFNLFLIHVITCDTHKLHEHTFTNIKTVLINLMQRYWVNFPNFKIKNLSLVLFYHLKSET